MQLCLKPFHPKTVVSLLYPLLLFVCFLLLVIIPVINDSSRRHICLWDDARGGDVSRSHDLYPSNRDLYIRNPTEDSGEASFVFLLCKLQPAQATFQQLLNLLRIYLSRRIIFTESTQLGKFCHRVAKSLCLSVSLFVPLGAFFRPLIGHSCFRDSGLLSRSIPLN